MRSFDREKGDEQLVMRNAGRAWNDVMAEK